MKTIWVHEFGDPEVLRLEEVPTPQLGPGQVLVRMHAVGVNPVETYIRAGTYAYKPFDVLGCPGTRAVLTRHCQALFATVSGR